MKKILLLITGIVAVLNYGYACPFCNKEIGDGIYNSQFYPNLFTMMSAFFALTAIVVVLSILATKRYKTRLSANPHVRLLTPVPLTTASMVLGIGMGGFLDGIVLHQIFQVHEMLSNKIPAIDYVGKSVNMFWDGIFHFFCLVVVLIGVILLWKTLFRQDINRSGKLLAGGLLLGWGLFNIVEGLINHHLLKLHNVLELSTNHAIGNYAFLGISVVLMIIGYMLVNNAHKMNMRSTNVIYS